MAKPLREYDEEIVSSKDWVKDNITSDIPSKSKNYLISLFPILQWISNYNLVWLYGDLVAGITVGAVLVPQGMSYAKIATLAPQYGLYSSFVGVFIYCFFATSKDVSIGPVAVMSLQVANVLASVISANPQYANDGALIATTLALICGAVALGMGLLRLGFILEFIPIPAVLGFMTGSALNIAVGQVPGLMGISTLLNTRAATYLVIINTLKQLKHTTLDAAFGLVPLFILYFSRWLMTFLSKRYPKYERVFFFGSVLRNALVIIFATLISWVVCRDLKAADYPISILKTVPSGLGNVGARNFDKNIMSALAGEIPISVVILLLEHIAISKSFGRINDYKINPNQELIAIGVTNLIGTFFNAYPATGSFSRSALKAKCGVRTPLAGIFTGAVVLLALYCLTGTFYWIPNATLSAVIIHAVGDLMAHPRTTFKFWKCSPLEAVMFVGAVLFTVFITIESGVYFSFAASLVFLLLRIAFPTGQFLGRVAYIQLKNPIIIKTVSESDSADNVKINNNNNQISKYQYDTNEEPIKQVNYIQPSYSNQEQATIKYKWVSLNHKNVNPDIKIQQPPSGVFVFKFGESFTYPNCSRQADILIDEIKRETRPGIDLRRQKVKLGDRPWNDGLPRKLVYDPNNIDSRPLLRAVIFDFSSTPHTDLTAMQNLVDIRNALNKYADRKVEYHFVGILSSWVRRALIAEGFGGDDNSQPENRYIEAAIRRSQLSGNLADSLGLGTEEDELNKKRKYKDEEDRDTSSSIDDFGEYIPVVGTNTPFFHFDIPDLD